MDTMNEYQRAAKADLSDNQRAMLVYIYRYRAANGQSPSMAEIAENTAMASTNTVSYHLDRLEDMGLVTRVPRRARAVRFTEDGEAIAKALYGEYIAVRGRSCS